MPRGDEAPSAADGLEGGIVEGVEARRLGELDASDETVDADEHAERHGSLLRAAAADRRIYGWRVFAVVGMRDRGSIAIAGPICGCRTCRGSAARTG